jgi:cystathionine gamma-synthase
MGGTVDWQNPGLEVYSRMNHNTRGRAEKVLSKVMNAEAITYGSGIAAAYAAFAHYAPSVIAIRKGYMSVHEGIKVFGRGRRELVSNTLLLGQQGNKADEFPHSTATTESHRPR